MAIAFRSTSTGTSVNALTSSISLPAGTTTGDVTVLFAQQATAANAGGTVPTMTAPAGWTVLVASNGVIVCWRAFQTGDPTTGITFTSSLANWWLSLAVTYSGCDTTAPIDASGSCFNISAGGTSTANNIFRAPSVCPNFMGSMLLTLHSYGNSTAHTIAVPSGMTSRANTATGPDLRICEKTLVDGTPTGDIDTTAVADGFSHFGMQVALKTSGAAGATLAVAQPSFGAIWNGLTSGNSATFRLDHLNVQNGDLTLIFFSGQTTAVTPPTGWTLLTGSTQGATCFYRTWSTGDPTTPAFTWSGSTWSVFDAICLRQAGSGATGAVIDTSGVATGTGTVATPTLTPTTSADLLLAYFGTRVATAGTWSGVTGGLSDIDITTSGPCMRFSSLMPSGNPTASYSATFSLGGTIDAMGMLVRAAPVGTGLPAVQARVLVMA